MTDETTERDDAQAALDEARRRLAEVPPHVVVTNHAMGLYELAAIHLSSEPPDLVGAQLAIDAVRALVEGLGDRLGDNAGTLRAAVTNIQMAYVEVARKTAGAHSPSPSGEPANGGGDDPANANDDTL